jgi:hypothetical protein
VGSQGSRVEGGRLELETKQKHTELLRNTVGQRVGLGRLRGRQAKTSVLSVNKEWARAECMDDDGDDGGGDAMHKGIAIGTVMLGCGEGEKGQDILAGADET